MKKQLSLLFLCISLLKAATGQIPQPLQTVPSPNAWSFTQYGKVQVSGFTGLPLINIPLHNVTYKDKEINTSLSYNATGFRPDMHASWVGTGWNLNLGGVITRQVNGLPDDFSYTIYDSCRCSPYVPDAPETFDLGFIRADHNLEYTLPNLMNASSYFVNPTYSPNSSSNPPTWIKYPLPLPYRGEYWGNSCWVIDKFFKGQYIPASVAPEGTYNMYTGSKDLQSDEYSFNVMGYTGKFYFTNSFDIKVVSEKNFTVSRKTFQDIPSELWQPNSASQAGATCTNWVSGFSPFRAMGKYPQVLRGFTLTAEDNTTFVFGNDAYWHDAIEYSISEYMGPGQAPLAAPSPQDYWIANAWYLTSVTFPDGRTINFEYERGEYQRSIFTSEFSFGVTQNNPSCAAANAIYTSSANQVSKVISPVYLKRISGDLLEAHLSWSNTDENNRLNEVNGLQFKWKKLDEVSFKDYEGKQYKWKFNYFPLSSRSQRLFLRDIEKFTLDNISVKEKYSLLYDTTLTLPDYNINQNDHWGFWNGVNSGTAMGNTNEQMDVKRSPVFSNTKTGVLKRLTFPTGGYNEFTFEQNSYSKRVKLQRYQGTEDVGTNKNTGGLRIRTLIAYDPIAEKTTTTDYYYVNGYTPNLTPAQIAALPSSGVLNQHSYIYHWDQVIANMYNYPTCLQNVKLKITSNQPMNPVLDDYHLGYSTVIEKYSDGSYKKQTYTNHDNGYTDDTAIANITTFESPYNRFSSRSQERGKPKTEEKYSSSNKLLSSVDNEYSAIDIDGATDPKSYFTRFTLNDLPATTQTANTYSYSVVPVSYLLSNQFKEYTYYFLPTRIISKLWDQTTNNYITNTKNISYSGIWPTVITQTNSQGKQVKEITKYPIHIPSGGFMMSRLRGYKNTVVEKITTIKEDSASEEKVISAALNEFYLNPYSSYSRPVIKNQYSLAISTPLTATSLFPTVAKDLTFSSTDSWYKDYNYLKENETTLYDKFQNPLNSTLRNGAQSGIITGYNNLRVIAKIKSAGGNYTQINATSFELQPQMKITEGSPSTIDVPDSDSWVLEGTRNTTDVFTGYNSFVGRVRFKENFITGTWFVTAKSSGTAPTLEKLNQPTGTYQNTNTVPSIVVESPGWKTYRFDFSGAGFLLAINSNGNVIDDVIIGPANSQIQDYTIYSYKDGLLTQITDEKHKKTFFEYDVIGRLKIVRDQDQRIVKMYDYQFQAPNHGNAVWEATGVTRCKPCSTEQLYTTDIQQREERDANPQSESYNQIRYVDNGSSSNCVISPAWQNTVTPLRCQKDVNNINTTIQEQEQRDLNPCSPSYNQTRWVFAGVNETACPLPACSMNVNCWGPSQKCIGGVCQTGVQVYTGSFNYDPRTGMYKCFYYYEFNDGSISALQFEWSYDICPI